MVVGVTVWVTVAVGLDVLVGEDVMVGVNVAVANRLILGPLALDNQATNRIIPTKTSRMTNPQIMKGPVFWLLR